MEEQKEVRGLPTNEIKSALIKHGYDVFCPECQHHFGVGGLTRNVTCPKCGHTWRVDDQGRPQTSRIY